MSRRLPSPTCLTPCHTVLTTDCGRVRGTCPVDCQLPPSLNTSYHFTHCPNHCVMHRVSQSPGSLPKDDFWAPSHTIVLLGPIPHNHSSGPYPTQSISQCFIFMPVHSKARLDSQMFRAFVEQTAEWIPPTLTFVCVMHTSYTVLSFACAMIWALGVCDFCWNPLASHSVLLYA